MQRLKSNVSYLKSYPTMKTKILTLLFLTILNVAFAAKPRTYYVRIKTEQGEAIARLYNQTPQHRDNFVKLVKRDFYNGTLFHRVIKNFMIQGGDPDSKTAKPAQVLGNGGLPYTVPAEFNPGLFHLKGALAAARDENPAKASNATQFYLVQGRPSSDSELDNIERRRSGGYKIPVNIRTAYKTIGGTLHLDQNYTVFGEIVRGIELVDAIASVKTDSNNRPLADISMTITLLKKRQIKKLEKELIQESFRSKLIMQ